MLKNRAIERAMLLATTLSLFGNLPIQEFLIWLAFLEIPALAGRERRASSMHAGPREATSWRGFF